METWLNLQKLDNSSAWMSDPQTDVWNDINSPQFRDDWDLCSLDGCTGSNILVGKIFLDIYKWIHWTMHCIITQNIGTKPKIPIHLIWYLIHRQQKVKFCIHIFANCFRFAQHAGATRATPETPLSRAPTVACSHLRRQLKINHRKLITVKVQNLRLYQGVCVIQYINK